VIGKALHQEDDGEEGEGVERPAKEAGRHGMGLLTRGQAGRSGSRGGRH